MLFMFTTLSCRVLVDIAKCHPAMILVDAVCAEVGIWQRRRRCRRLTQPLCCLENQVAGGVTYPMLHHRGILEIDIEPGKNHACHRWGPPFPVLVLTCFEISPAFLLQFNWVCVCISMLHNSNIFYYGIEITDPWFHFVQMDVPHGHN